MPQTQTRMIDVAAARDIALAQVAPLADVDEVALADALGRIAAREVLAATAMPFFTCSAMDGFAVSTAALMAGPLRLPIGATLAAGTGAAVALPDGMAARIYTGAPVPEGADAVVPIEEIREEDGHVVLSRLPEAGANIRRAGSDQPQGAVLLAPGTRIMAHHVGLLAANGIDRISVIRRPRIAVLSTGDELAAGARGAGQIHDANRPMLLALIRAAGAEALDGGMLPDDLAQIADRLAELAATADLVVTSGGASMGGLDLLRPAVVAAGGTIAAWRVAVKPGKPVIFGKLSHTGFTGLPGNPFAAFVGFHLFIAAQIDRMTGRDPRPFAPVKARADFFWRRSPGRQEVFPVRCLGTDGTGLPILERLGQGVSGTLFPLTSADGLAVIPVDCGEVIPGQTLDWHPFCGE